MLFPARRRQLVVFMGLPIALLALVMPLCCCCETAHDQNGASPMDSQSSCAFAMRAVCEDSHCGPCPQRLASLNNSGTKQDFAAGTLNRVPVALGMTSSLTVSSNLLVLTSYPVLESDGPVNSLRTIILLI
jgi:hypothetical protein